MKMKVKFPIKLPSLSKISFKPTVTPPGTPVFAGEKSDEPVRITAIDYDIKDFTEKQIEIEQSFGLQHQKTVSWINIDGLNDAQLMEKIGKGFDIHPLTMEDVLHVNQRAKYEDSGTYNFVVLRMLMFDDKLQTVDAEQVSFIITDSSVLSFQEKRGDVFDRVRERIRNNKGKVRKMGADYLLYCLIDSIVDNYFVVLEKLAEKIENLEERLMYDPQEDHLRMLHALRREMIFVRKSIWPLRELLNGIIRGESKLITAETKRYFGDIYDHSIQIMDTVESFRDVVSGLMEMYLSVVSNRMNSVMKVLTIIATIFIPLTFIAGIYGMNFKYMPELQWRWAYFAVLGIMALVTIGMLVYFRKKKWI